MKLPAIGNLNMGTGLVIGAAAVLLTPVVLPVAAGIVKSLAKAGIKGGLILYEKGKVAVEEAKETMEDLAAEAKSELAEGKPASTVKKKAASAGSA
jgi:hypothetical protein